MSFICRNGTLHSHETVYQSKVCWGLISLPTIPPTRPVAAVTPVKMVSQPQLDYIEKLGGDVVHAYKLTCKEASDYIDQLKKEGRRAPVTQDPRLDLIKGLVEFIPDGYYAVQPEDGAHIDFLRVNRPKETSRNKYAGAIKFQTQHGPRLENAGVLWPSGQFHIWKSTLIDNLMLLVADHRTAAVRYAEKINRCMRCNAELTDDRSRWYGIGPECETKHGWGWVIEAKDERQEMTFEQARARGLVNLSAV